MSVIYLVVLFVTEKLFQLPNLSLTVDGVIANYPDERSISGGYSQRLAVVGCCFLGASM